MTNFRIWVHVFHVGSFGYTSFMWVRNRSDYIASLQLFKLVFFRNGVFWMSFGAPKPMKSYVFSVLSAVLRPYRVRAVAWEAGHRCRETGGRADTRRKQVHRRSPSGTDAPGPPKTAQKNVFQKRRPARLVRHNARRAPFLENVG